MPFENGNTYGKNNKRGLDKNKEAIKEYLEKICNELIKEMDLGKLSASQRISLVKTLLPYILPKKKEVDVTSDFVEQPIFEVNVLDSSDLKERLDRFEDYAKDKDIKLEDFS
ncbi:hypothetical protein N8376_05195 [Flavobacteriaceae bacterium]|nr:hypothetical protein [Flavobacteriaceae bacterium]